MDNRWDLHREITRQSIEEERADIALKRNIRAARIASGEHLPLRSRVSRLLMRTAIAIDPEEGWKHFRAQIYGGVNVRNLDG